MGFAVADAVAEAVADAVAVAVADAVAVAVAGADAVAVALGVVSAVVDADVAGTTGSVGLGSLHPAIIIADDTSTAAAAKADGRPAQKGHSLAARTWRRQVGQGMKPLMRRGHHKAALSATFAS